jgi:hypothetical protein
MVEHERHLVVLAAFVASWQVQLLSTYFIVPMRQQVGYGRRSDRSVGIWATHFTKPIDFKTLRSDINMLVERAA